MDKTIHIYGAGLAGLSIARLLQDKGYQVTIFEQSFHIGGSLRTHRTKKGVEIHECGAHIFHTNDEDVWNFVNKYSEWTPYVHKVRAMITKNDNTYTVPLPLSYETLKAFYQRNDLTEEDCKLLLNSTTRMKHPNKDIDNLISKVGWDMYDYIIKPYTENQWGCNIENAPLHVIDRIGFRDSHDTNYFNDKYQALPKNGYDTFIKNLSDGLHIELNTYKVPEIGVINIYTGSIDDLLDVTKLPYRSLHWSYRQSYFPWEGLVNEEYKYPVLNTPMKNCTRIINHNYFGKYNSRIYNLSYEYPEPYNGTNQRYYPIPKKEYYDKYLEYAAQVKALYPKMILHGRLGLYKYLNMDQVIKYSLEIAKKL